METVGTVARVAGKSLTPDENSRVRAAVRALLEQQGGNQSELAPRLGIKQPTLSAFVSGRHGAGYSFARRVAELMGVTPDELLAGAPTSAPRGVRWNEHEGWAKAVETARREYPEWVPDFAYVEGGKMIRGRAAGHIDAKLALQVARTWIDSADDEERAAATLAYARTLKDADERAQAEGATDSRPPAANDR